MHDEYSCHSRSVHPWYFPHFCWWPHGARQCSLLCDSVLQFNGPLQLSLLYKMVSMTPHSTPHSSPDMSDLGCAVGVTGKLLNSSERLCSLMIQMTRHPILALELHPNPLLTPSSITVPLLHASLLVLITALVPCILPPGWLILTTLLEGFDEEEDEEDDNDVRTEAGDEVEYLETLAMTIADQYVIHSTLITYIIVSILTLISGCYATHQARSHCRCVNHVPEGQWT